MLQLEGQGGVTVRGLPVRAGETAEGEDEGEEDAHEAEVGADGAE